MRSLIFILIMLHSSNSFSQSKYTFDFSGYLETYYAYNTSSLLKNNTSQFPFTYNHNRQNEVNINLGLLKAKFEQDGIRANLGMMIGSYAAANLAAEPIVAKFIYEANAGVKLSNKRNLWLDAGVLPSHIGYETAIGTENLTLTRSLMADNSPYYETGARVAYTSKNEKNYLAFLVLNGWQNIYKTLQNEPSIGFQYTYTPNAKLKINYSNFYGKIGNKIDNLKRFYNDFYVEYTLHTNTKIAAVIDFGRDNSDFGKQSWFTSSLQLQRKFNRNHSITVRGEYFNDTHYIFMTTNTYLLNNPLCASINYDYTIRKNAMFRIEPKFVFANSYLKTIGQIYIPSCAVFTSSLCLNF